LYANERMVQMLGTTSGEIMTRTVLDFTFPEDEPEGRARIGSNLRGHFEQFELRFRRVDGSELHTMASTSPVRDGTGHIVGALGMFTDITVRKQMERALRQSEDLLRVALKNSPITVYQQDRNLRYTWIYNPLSAFTPENIIGKTDADFVSPKEAKRLTELKQRVLTSGQSVREEIHVTSGAGVNAILLTIEPLRDSSGTIIGVTGTAIDMTERKRLEREVSAQASELEALFEAITDGIFVYDATGRPRRMNVAARTLLSRYIPPDDFSIPAKERAERYGPRSPDGRPLAAEQMPVMRMLRGEEFTGARTMDVVVRTFGGDDLWLNMSGTPLRDAEGRITGAIAIARDVSERRQLEQRTHAALEALLKMAKVMVQGSDADALLGIETGGSTHEVMQRLADLAREVLGCSRLSFSRIEPETEVLRPLAVVGLSGEQEQRWWQEQEQQPGRLSDGPDPSLVARLRADEILEVDLTLPPYADLPNPYGISQMLVAPLILGTHLLGFLSLDYGGLAHDYTEEEVALVRAVARLATLVMERDRLFTETTHAQANALAAAEARHRMDTFLGIASHELKTPLTTIKGNLQLAHRRIAAALREVATENERLQHQLEDVQKMLDRAERQVGIQNRLVSDLVDISRIQADKLELRLETIDLATIIREIVEDQRFAAPERLIIFGTSVLTVSVRVDAERIGQVVNNYLSNALKYSPADRPVTVRLDVQGELARVAVRDEGPGLSTEQQARIWERFYRVPEIQVQSGSGVGLGLGLHISRAIIEQHGGQVGVQSTPGQGSTFWFTLPLCPNESPQNN
jgi:PAS domain S-box-containing protein